MDWVECSQPVACTDPHRRRRFCLARHILPRTHPGRKSHDCCTWHAGTLQVLRNCVKLTDVGLAKLAGLSGRELPQLWVRRQHMWARSMSWPGDEQ